MTKYLVRFIYYKYNTGRGDNGTYAYDTKFNTLEEAETFIKEVNANLKDSEYCYEVAMVDGFFERFEGLYKEEIVRIK